MNLNRILIVDDDQLILQVLGKALKTEATEVTTADTGEKAIAEIAASYYKLCFLDISLPDMDGLEVMKIIQSSSPATKVTIMTAGIINHEMKETIENQAFMFLAKPFDLLQVKMLTRRILEES